MTAFLLALQFLTVATLRRELDCRPEDFARSRAWFGLVGALLGLVLAGLAWLLGRVLPPMPLAAVLLFLWAAATRFLHLDGVADTADALVHTTSRQRALEIMKDTRVGAFGLAAVSLVLIAKFAALASLAGPALWGGLVAAPACARAMSAALSCLLPAAKPGQGLGAAMAARRDPWPALAAGATALAASFLAAGAAGLWAALAVLVLGVLLGRWFLSRVGGVTGDTLGAAIELGEVTALMTLCALS